MKKNILSLSLASTLLISTVAFAGGSDVKLISQSPNDKEAITIEAEDMIEEEFNYVSHKGKITEVNNEDGSLSIVVDEKDTLDSNEASTMSSIKFNISKDTVILSDKTKDSIEGDKLVEGAVVEVSFGKNNKMTKSLPPITNADVIVLREATGDDALMGVKVEKFDDDNISADNFLKFNISKDTVIVDQKGNKVKESDIKDKDLIVFYGPVTTMSIPAQSNAVKIIALLEEKAVEVPETPETPETPEVNTEIKVLDKIIYNGKEIKLKNKLSKSGDVFMMPIREIGELLEYKVSWKGASKQVELTKGANYLTATANEDMYSKAKMIVKLGKASNLKNGTTYVPVNFITEVMQLEMEVTKDGVISIK